MGKGGVSALLEPGMHIRSLVILFNGVSQTTAHLTIRTQIRASKASAHSEDMFSLSNLQADMVSQICVCRHSLTRGRPHLERHSEQRERFQYPFALSGRICSLLSEGAYLPRGTGRVSWGRPSGAKGWGLPSALGDTTMGCAGSVSWYSHTVDWFWSGLGDTCCKHTHVTRVLLNDGVRVRLPRVVPQAAVCRP